jgi:hypothetical protein
MSQRLKISFDDREAENLAMLIERYGGTPQSFVRGLINRAFEKEFGGYKAKGTRKVGIVGDEITNEQFCEMMGGKVVRDGELTMCLLKRPEAGGGYSVPIGDRTRIKGYAKSLELIR